jgi:hypothetical protein
MHLTVYPVFCYPHLYTDVQYLTTASSVSVRRDTLIRKVVFCDIRKVFATYGESVM